MNVPKPQVYTGPTQDFNTQAQPFSPPEGIVEPEPHEPVDFNVHPTPFGHERSARMSFPEDGGRSTHC